MRLLEDEPEGAPERALLLEDMPEHLRLPGSPELKAERRQWLSDHGFTAMDWVQALMPRRPGGGR